MRIDKTIVIILLFTLICSISCGFSISSRSIQQVALETFPPVFVHWKGNYNGSVTWGYGDKISSKGIPSQLTISQYGKEVRFELVTDFENRRWLFYIKPTLFSSPSVNFSATQEEGGRTCLYKVTLSLYGKDIKGKLERHRRYETYDKRHLEYYLLDFTKVEK